MDVTVWECVGQNREGDHLRVAKPEDPPHPPPSWARLKQRSGSARYRRLPVFHATQSGTQSRSNHTDEKAARSWVCSLNLARYKVITETILTVKEPKQNPTTNRTAAKQHFRTEPIPLRPTTTSAQRNTTKSEESLNISNVLSIQHRITAAWPEGRGVGRGNGLHNYECFPSPQNFPALKKQKIILRKKFSYKKTH